MSKAIVQTPLMKQYNQIKSKHPDALLLFRVGDFYETFSEDAIKTSEILNITLTRRANGSASFIELAGFPFHALDTYLPKLVRAGQRVAICEQLEDPKLTKTIVKRGITELITPGISLHDQILEVKENNFVASIYFHKDAGGIAFLDISTGEFYLTEGRLDFLDKLLNSLMPKEVLYEKSQKEKFSEVFGNKFYNYPLDDWMFVESTNYDRLIKQFNTQSLKGFGVEELKLGITAAGAILHYLDLTHHDKNLHINSISRIESDSYVWLDKFTLRNLELFYPLHEGGKSVLNVLDKTSTPMGARLLKRWLGMPLRDPQQILNRLNKVEYLVQNEETTQRLKSLFYEIGDLERLVSKLALYRINPREILQLARAIGATDQIKNICQETAFEPLTSLAGVLNSCSAMKQRIETEINAEAPAQLNKGKVIASGVNEELDELRNLSEDTKKYLMEMQERETKLTAIPSLKIGFNNVFGYYFEVRNTHKNRVPQSWIRKQTLVSAERYITPELKDFEEKILKADDRIQTIEAEMYTQLLNSLMAYIPALQSNAQLISQLDVLTSFAQIAKERKYTKPTVHDGDSIDIVDGRHPVIELQLPITESYVPNSVQLDTSENQIIIITGPNMAGKSALLRQTALIVLMAQIGSFVPAHEANIGYVDKIFTRVGASDNISSGESTFMVEMNEAASILNNLSARSLVLFDELGRGTSTYDGISIAWSIAEYIHEHPRAKAKTLFATHYHELNEMEKSFNRIKNYNVSVREVGNKIIFLRKLERGGSEHSFGIHVAQMAGLPKSVIERANNILTELEGGISNHAPAKNVEEISKHREGYQMSIFQLDDPVLKQIRDEIKNLDLNNLTPIQALNKLNDIKRIIGL